MALRPGLTSSTELPGVIVQMFEWTWDSIATECTQYLGPAGTLAKICRLRRVTDSIPLSLGYGFVQG